MKKLNTFWLDNLIAINFGQDYDLFGSGESVEAQVDAWIADNPPAARHGLIGDIEQFIEQSDNLEEDFESCYGSEFSTELWDTTPMEFLNILKEKARASLI